MNITFFIRFPLLRQSFFDHQRLFDDFSGAIWCLCQATDQSTEGALDLLGFPTEGLQIVHSMGVRAHSLLEPSCSPQASGTAVAWPRWLDR